MPAMRNDLNIDLATILGLLIGFLLVAIAIVAGGSPASFLNLPSALIVILGTFAVTSASFSVDEIASTPRRVVRALINGQVQPHEAASAMIGLAEQARKKGILTLQNKARNARKEPFLAHALRLVIDGAAPDDIEKILAGEVSAMAGRHAKSAQILRRAAEVSPAMGLIGTLVGLVQMLANLDDPSTIGPSMAVALLTTFYGAVLAFMVFTPLAVKLERNSSEEALLNTVYALSVASIGRKENPRRLEISLNTLLPPAQRVNYFGS